MNDFPYYQSAFEVIMVSVAVSLDQILEYDRFEKKRLAIEVCFN